MNRRRRVTRAGCAALLMGLLCILSLQTVAGAFTLSVADPAGNPVLTGFRWQVEEDTTHPVTPGALVADSLAVSVHKSYAPVVANGHVAAGTSSVVINLPDDVRYAVSVLPDADYSISGQNVGLGQDSVTVVVNASPIPTSQISVLVFHDNNPVNNIPDQGESPLEGFSVIISDIFGRQMMDAFGNMLGTTYQTDANTGEFLLDGEGAPIVDMLGSAVLRTDPNGEVLIKNIAPGKYAVEVVPPPDQTGWVQTSTIEGTPVVDAWVKANEPPFFVELGPAGWHCFYGFVKQMNNLGDLPNPGGTTGTITGRVMYNHFDRPPNNQGYVAGEPVGGAWVGLNLLNMPFTGLYTAPCDENGYFSIADVPPGDYQLVTWDLDLLAIFGFNAVNVPAGGGTIDLGDVLSFRWFGTFKGSVFLDTDEDGFPDPGEMGIMEQNVNIRFRDGTIYQAQPTDMMGEYELSGVFPFFKWLVIEVDFARFKATGMTAIIDWGGAIPPDNGWDMPSGDVLNPQPQVDANGTPIINPNTLNNLSRTETGPVLTQAMHLFLSQTNIVHWGKTAYGPGENGGISGIVYYATVRAEDDPRYAAAEPWEPGIPRVQVNLYRDSNKDGVIDDLDGSGGPTLADVDNYPFGWMDDPGQLGPEDVDRNSNGEFDAGDAIAITTTDSWDDNNPEGSIQDPIPVIHGVELTPGYDNYGVWNQVRPGVFDGGYAFDAYFPGGIASGSSEVEGLPMGCYIVEATTPPGHVLVKEEDKNVDFGDTYTPGTALLPPILVGDLHLVPDELSLFPGVECAFAGQMRPLADRKQIMLKSSQNAAADFFFFTPVPKAARAVGFINNDFAAEFDKSSPIFGEKAAPSWVPISFQDWYGNEVARVYSDEWGCYNALLPSTFTTNILAPSGMSPQMLTFIINHPGPIPDPNNPGQMMIDPWYNPDWGQSPFTFNFMPGTTTYLDTPVAPVGAFVGYPNGPLDVEPNDGYPLIYSVMGPDGGPLVCDDGDTVTITSRGNQAVPNPAYDGKDANIPAMVIRDHGFGDVEGAVTVGGATLNITSWSNSTITATVDFGDVSTGTLHVVRGDNGNSTDLGITLHVGACGNVTHVTGGAMFPQTPIQDAIDAATDGALIIIEPGSYWENPIVYKNVTLQGSGAESTIIYGNPVPTHKVSAWNNKIDALVADGDIPAAAANFLATAAPGILVYSHPGIWDANAPASIDGLQIAGAVAGGGIHLNAYVDYFEIRNNKVRGNQGTLGGGVIIGRDEALGFPNTYIKVHHNHIVKNGGLAGGGGGVTILGGSTGYEVTDNLIMGNFTSWYGGGIDHYGLSDNGLIARNRIIANEVFYGAPAGGNGGGIYIASRIDPEDPGELDDGSGSVTIINNLIQGNMSGSGLGGGICAEVVNGADTQDPDPNNWYTLTIFNNIIVNNVAANAAGGIFLQDVARALIIHNTVANNDSTAAAANTFTPGNLLLSNPQPAGIVSRAHSQNLANLTGQSYSNPVLVNNIIHGNRSFHWDASLNGGSGGLAANPTTPVWDLAVIGLPGANWLNPDNCVLTALSYGDGADYDDGSNVAGDPGFASAYNNTLMVAAVIDEGGNFVTTRFEPIGRAGDYHITCGSNAINVGAPEPLGDHLALNWDYDGQTRPGGILPDAGADEIIPACSADFDVDGDVDNIDLAIWAANWLTYIDIYETNPVDLNGDGDIDLEDFAVMQDQWGRTDCCP